MRSDIFDLGEKMTVTFYILFWIYVYFIIVIID